MALKVNTIHYSQHEHSPKYRSITSPDCFSFLPLKSHICEQFSLQIFHPPIQLWPGWRGPGQDHKLQQLSCSQHGKAMWKANSCRPGWQLWHRLNHAHTPPHIQVSFDSPHAPNKAAIQEPGEACSLLMEPWRLREADVNQTLLQPSLRCLPVLPATFKTPNTKVSAQWARPAHWDALLSTQAIFCLKNKSTAMHSSTF